MTMKLSTSMASLMKVFEQPDSEAAPAAAVPKKRGFSIDPRRELTELFARVAASDPSLTTLDLSANRQFIAMSTAIKNQASLRPLHRPASPLIPTEWIVRSHSFG